MTAEAAPSPGRPLLRSTRERAREDALISLAGPLAQGAALAWPLGRTSDEKSVAASVETIAGDRGRPQGGLSRTAGRHRGGRPAARSTNALELALASALETGRLDQRGIAEVCGAVARSFDDDDERSGDDMGHRKRISDRDRRDLDQFLDSLAKALAGPPRAQQDQELRRPATDQDQAAPVLRGHDLQVETLRRPRHSRGSLLPPPRQKARSHTQSPCATSLGPATAGGRVEVAVSDLIRPPRSNLRKKDMLAVTR